MLGLALIVAKEMNRLPLSVMFLDQEAEWESTIDVIRSQMNNPDVKPYWYQMPFKLFNATSSFENWLKCWAPEDEHRWMRKREEISIKENIYGTDRFVKLFTKIAAVDHKNIKTAFLTGVRCEESPGRRMGLVGGLTYKAITWGKVLSSKMEQYTFHPIYDWRLSDVWTAIHKNKWVYSNLYNQMFRSGKAPGKMRVSNVHHETAVESLFDMAEIEPKTWERLTQRISGIDMAAKFGRMDYFPKKLPAMFTSWSEYRDYLLEKLIIRPDWYKSFKAVFKDHDENIYPLVKDVIVKIHISSILTNDWEFVKIKNYVGGAMFIALGNKEHKAKIARLKKLKEEQEQTI